VGNGGGSVTRYVLMEAELRDVLGLLIHGITPLGTFDSLDAIDEFIVSLGDDHDYRNVDVFVIAIHEDGTVQALVDNGWGTEWVANRD
jgi:hypothetical protein